MNTFNFMWMQIFLDFIRITTQLGYFGDNCYIFWPSYAKIHIHTECENFGGVLKFQALLLLGSGRGYALCVVFLGGGGKQ